VKSQPAVTLRDIYRARRTILPSVRHTPLVPSADLSQRTGASVFLKLETLQQTGSFKIRGATNRLMHLDANERARGVVAVSTGNHGRAVARAARALGMRTTDLPKTTTGFFIYWFTCSWYVSQRFQVV